MTGSLAPVPIQMTVGVPYVVPMGWRADVRGQAGGVLRWDLVTAAPGGVTFLNDPLGANGTRSMPGSMVSQVTLNVWQGGSATPAALLAVVPVGSPPAWGIGKDSGFMLGNGSSNQLLAAPWDGWAKVIYQASSTGGVLEMNGKALLVNGVEVTLTASQYVCFDVWLAKTAAPTFTDGANAGQVAWAGMV
jgi:hypothetical protein